MSGQEVSGLDFIAYVFVFSAICCVLGWLADKAIAKFFPRGWLLK